MPASPASLHEWQRLILMDLPAVRQAWEQFEPFFNQHGYRLFVVDPERSDALVPPSDCSRIHAEDHNCRFLPECLHMDPQPSVFRPQTGIHVAARSPRNTDVVVRIITIGNEGQNHLAILRALASTDAQVPENRTVPMTAELEKDDVVFGIFPLMWPQAMYRPWFETMRELLEALERVLEGFVYLHQRLIAHRDFDLAEVFSNYGRGFDFTKSLPRCYSRPPFFRSRCPDMRYMINDFELSVQFAPDSEPQSRVVTGIPTARYGDTAKDYGKHLPPEALIDAPYCPFKADIYQFGKSAQYRYQNVQTLPSLQALFAAMASDNPVARPTAAEALAVLRGIRQTASEDALEDVPGHNFLEYRRILPGEACSCNCCTRPPPRVTGLNRLVNRLDVDNPAVDPKGA